MKIINGYLDYSVKPEENQVHIFTGNAFIRTDGALVQGRGAALEVKNLYPCVPFALGDFITKYNNKGVDYLIAESFCSGHSIWAFQVKHSYRDNADLVLIKRSTECLKEIAETFKNKEYHINFPGIGNGHLSEKEVIDIISALPDNVFIYK